MLGSSLDFDFPFIFIVFFWGMSVEYLVALSAHS